MLYYGAFNKINVMKEIKCWFFCHAQSNFKVPCCQNNVTPYNNNNSTSLHLLAHKGSHVVDCWLFYIVVYNATILYVQRKHYSFKMSTEHESKEFISRLLFILSSGEKKERNEEKKFFFIHIFVIFYLLRVAGRLCLVDCVRCWTIAVASHSFFPFSHSFHSFVHCGIGVFWQSNCVNEILYTKKTAFFCAHIT